MPKKDLNQLAKFIVDQATGEISKPEDSVRTKAGRLGGVKGGAARARILTPEERSKIATLAAQARWKKGKAD